jgi:tRNA A-37 threonylcarbamoyl transferase component Bud32
MILREAGMELIDAVMKWIVAPVAAFVWLLHSKVQTQTTDIAVLKATAEANKQAHDREFKQIQDSFKAVFEKLNIIEEALRK